MKKKTKKKQNLIKSMKYNTYQNKNIDDYIIGISV